MQRQASGDTTRNLLAAKVAARREGSAGTDAALVQRMRSNRASWDNVARAVGRPVDAVRRDYDPTYEPPHVPASPVCKRPSLGSRPHG